MKNTKGFGVVEVIIILVVLGLIGVGGWYVWRANDRTTGSQQSPTDTDTVSNPYEGWKSYCDHVYKICFKYPADWSLAQNGEDDTYSIRMVNATNTVAATYLRNDTRDGATLPYYTTVVKDLPTADSRFKIIGGFVSTLPIPELKIVDSTLLVNHPLVANTEAQFTNTARFKHTDGTNSSFEVSPIGSTFTTDQAKVWFNGDDGKLSALIVESFRLQ